MYNPFDKLFIYYIMMKIKRVRIMPIVINHVVIPNVTGGVVTFGDTYYVSPKSNSKTAQGSGSSNTGICVNTNSGLSNTNTLDPDGSDQTGFGNG
jgi:spore germination protein PF